MNTTELGSRRLHVWRGRHHGSTRPHGLVDAVKEDTATLAEAIVEAVELFNAGGQLVQLDPTGKIIVIYLDSAGRRKMACRCRGKRFLSGA